MAQETEQRSPREKKEWRIGTMVRAVVVKETGEEKEVVGHEKTSLNDTDHRKGVTENGVDKPAGSMYQAFDLLVIHVRRRLNLSIF